MLYGPEVFVRAIFFSSSVWQCCKILQVVLLRNCQIPHDIGTVVEGQSKLVSVLWVVNRSSFELDLEDIVGNIVWQVSWNGSGYSPTAGLVVVEVVVVNST
jgi:hypothetical protein